ncbi:hypothetical protein [Saccharibacillus kuerlensis]|uniref:YhfM-like domain-containing protein n=1 Tax=Saccharibacillus kuerlensis TaxID=459527 RepID=A0ABQ2L496_9BACL|nr:hypothetical protein [Saccharibacillus kuerlensis]GGO01894.1 hypothetical protein GCM10010969_24660 [Saccharibacillus kuerlensis]
MKILLRAVAIMGCVLIFSGCSDRKPEGLPSGGAEQKTNVEQIVEEMQKWEITEINIFKSESHGSIGGTLLKKLSNAEEFSVVLQSLSTANQMLGIADTAIPDYDFVIVLDQKDSFAFHYWLDADDRQGMLADVNDTGILYTLSQNSVQDLLQLIE